MKLVQELSVLKIKNLPAGAVRAVGGVPGLKICVSDSGTSRSWVLRLQVGSKRRELGLGGFPAVSLAEAREKARRMRLQVADGVDPIEDRERKKAALIAQQRPVLTFERFARDYVADRSAGWSNDKHRAQWLSTLEQYAFPVIGGLALSAIGRKEVLAVLEQQCTGKVSGKLWHTKTETARRLRGRIESILDEAEVREHRTGQNPARWKGCIEKALLDPRQLKDRNTRHHPAMKVEAVPAFMHALRQHPGTVSQALQMLVLTACRSGEIRGARWDEIDIERAIWTIPDRRMKCRREHRVPLSRPVVELLQSMRRAAPDGELLFPSTRATPLSDMALNEYMRRHAVGSVPHGFRSTFRDWAAEAGYPFEVCEAALAHKFDNKVVTAYFRTDLLDKRREMMAKWAEHCLRDYKTRNLLAIAA